MHRILITLLLAIFSFSAINAQSGDKDLDIRAGLGMSKFKSGGGLLTISEYELNVKWTDYFTVSPSIVLNHNGSLDTELATFFQANLNVFGSLFRNDRKNDFRIGSGLSFYKLNRGTAYASNNSFGLNFIVEDRYMISERFFIGVKAFIQPYFDKEIHSGIILKAGINL